MAQWLKYQCGPGSIPGLDVICGLSLLLVLYSAPRGFSPGTPVFPSLPKPTFPNSNSIRMQDLPENHFAVSGASWVNIMIYLFIGTLKLKPSGLRLGFLQPTLYPKDERQHGKRRVLGSEMKYWTENISKQHKHF